jgi:hypothetical protein
MMKYRALKQNNLLRLLLILFVLATCALDVFAAGKVPKEGDTQFDGNNQFNVEMLNPKGDPTKSEEALEGENEFTFSTDDTGVCLIRCSALVTPVPTDAWANENVVWSISPEVPGSTLEWGRKNEVGTVVYGPEMNKGLEVWIRFTNLPALNSSFGKKTITLTVGKTTKTNDIEIFFPRDAKNSPDLNQHPFYKEIGGSPNMSDKPFGEDSPVRMYWPNWMYYWFQTVNPLGPNPKFTFFNVNTGSVDYRPPPAGPGFINFDKSIVNDPYDAPYSPSSPLSGIDTFAWLVIHESQHYADWEEFWGNDTDVWDAHKDLEDPDDDKDRDRIPNKIEDVNLNKIFDTGDLLDWSKYQTRSLEDGRHKNIINDFEEWDAQRHKNVVGDHTKDWANPGKQHS